MSISTLHKGDDDDDDNDDNKTHVQEHYRTCVISGFRHDVDEICDLLGYYATCSGNSLPTSRNIAEDCISQLWSK